MAYPVASDPVPMLMRRSVRVISVEELETIPVPAHPDLARLADSGVLHRLMPGYYAMVPTEHIGTDWVPELEAAAWAIAAAKEGPRTAVLMGLSAARCHGAIEEPLSVAIIATGHSHLTARLTDRDAVVSIIRRDLPRLKAARYETELGQSWVTTVEQTMLDLAAYPLLGGLSEQTHAAIDGLLPKVDQQLLYNIAVGQRKYAALDRILEHV